jgi:hypothetical protein
MFIGFYPMEHNGPGLEIVRDCRRSSRSPVTKIKDNKKCQNTTATRIFSEAVLTVV